ncbi:PREDICTED: olfactory receptor 6N2-like [Nanorana parkeri]|uniref:olfactory receptor 6N2-like n=1 Tax=Nanorana parkeri TaxID=125878 RepID=UPI000854D5D7|nr:PREDICTED: olfactory receptor 6N2-like [Nanorana parkeri]
MGFSDRKEVGEEVADHPWVPPIGKQKSQSGSEGGFCPGAGFTDITNEYNNKLIFLLFILLFIFITCGNAVVMLVIIFDSHLHTPMYIFIGTLSVVEICIVMTVYPTLLVLFLKGKAYISFDYCFLQMYSFDAFLITENYLLTVMAYDRYVAICKALRYHTIMTLKTSPLLTLACSSSNLDVSMDLSVSSFTIILNSIFIVFLYSNILFVILNMKTSWERKKAFSTCVSHLIMSLVFYGSVAFMYIQLHQSYSPEYDLASAIHHSVLTPLLSPLVYSFRNKEIKSFLKRLLKIRS